jgi:rod shape-determining protein MreC
MAVVTPDGLVGKVIAVYPLASQILLVTDPTFSVGVESTNHVRGTLNCKSSKDCTVDYIQNEEKVQPGDAFYTSGEDRVFPKGFPAGMVTSARPGQLMKEVRLVLSTPPNAAEEVLVILEGVHQQIPDTAQAATEVTRLLPPPPPDSTGAPHAVRLQTEADKIKEKYVELGAQQNHVFGEHGSSVPNFNIQPKPAQPTNAAAANSAAPAANSTTLVAGPSPAQTQAPNAPAALGAAKTKSTVAPATNATTKTTGPALPLGAPRRKPEGPQQ